jgi:signal transduction histidine kinase
MDSNVPKLIFFLFLLFSFNSCKEKIDENLSVNVYIDSVKYYNKIVKADNIKDSLKLNFIKRTFSLNKKISIDSIRIKNNDTIAYNFLKYNDNKNYILASQINLSDAIKLNDTARITKTYSNLGYFYLKRNIHDSAFFNFDKVQKIYAKKGILEKVNEHTLNKASSQYQAGDYLGCETTIFRALFSLKRQKNDLNLNIAFTLIGISKIELKEYEESIEYLNLALDLTKNLDPSKCFNGIAYNNLGLVYFKKQDYEKAIEYYKKAIDTKDFEKTNLQVYTMAKEYMLFSKFKLGQIDNFKKDYNEIIKNFNSLNLSSIQPKIQLSEFYESQNNIKSAQRFALEAYNLSVKEKLYREKLIALKQLTNVFPEKAKYYSNEYIKLTDSIAAVDKKTQNTFARIEYRVDELNNENLLLAERNKQLIYYFVIGALLLSMFYFYRWQKQKQREFVLIQEQQKANEDVYSLMINQQSQMDYVKAQEQKRISQELHDGILGKLFGARMNLDFLNSQETEEIKKDKAKYIQEIIQVEKQIRQISHELNDEKLHIINNYQLMIDRLVEEQEKLLKINIDYTCDKKVPWDKLSAEEKINLYRIFQETFHNIYKYANTKSVFFSIIHENNNLKISILDNGKGFNLTKAFKGIGVKNMRERANLINAVYTIDSEIKKGTTTQIVLKINPNKEF